MVIYTEDISKSTKTRLSVENCHIIWNHTWKLHDTYTCTMLKNEKEHDRPSVLKYRKKKGNIKLYAIYGIENFKNFKSNFKL